MKFFEIFFFNKFAIFFVFYQHTWPNIRRYFRIQKYLIIKVYWYYSLDPILSYNPTLIISISGTGDLTSYKDYKKIYTVNDLKSEKNAQYPPDSIETKLPFKFYIMYLYTLYIYIWFLKNDLAVKIIIKIHTVQDVKVNGRSFALRVTISTQTSI